MQISTDQNVNMVERTPKTPSKETSDLLSRILSSTDAKQSNRETYTKIMNDAEYEQDSITVKV